LLNLQKNTREGIHAANTGGVWQTVGFGFAGVSIKEDGILSISPNMPKEWESLTFRIHYLNSWLEIMIDKENHTVVKILQGDSITVRVNGETKEI